MKDGPEQGVSGLNAMLALRFCISNKLSALETDAGRLGGLEHLRETLERETLERQARGKVRS